jgi:hypothetical protein
MTVDLELEAVSSPCGPIHPTHDATAEQHHTPGVLWNDQALQTTQADMETQWLCNLPVCYPRNQAQASGPQSTGLCSWHFHKSKTTCLQLSSVFLAIDHSVSVSHLVAKQFLLVLCIIVWIVLQAKLLEVLFKGCNRVTNHVEEVSSGIPSLLPSICDTCKFCSIGKIFAPVSPFSILS